MSPALQGEGPSRCSPLNNQSIASNPKPKCATRPPAETGATDDVHAGENRYLVKPLVKTRVSTQPQLESNRVQANDDTQ
ncbi:MAG: hypothetical protein WD002_10215 [Pseudomonadales bacterium]